MTSVGAALAALALACAAQAQDAGSVRDFRLPPAPSSTPAPAGPVDSDHPVAAPAPQPSPTASAEPSPAIALPPATADADRPRTRAAPPAQPTGPIVAPPAIPESPVALEPQPDVPLPLPSAAPALPEATPAPRPASASPTDESTGGWPLALALAIALVLIAAAAFAVWRRKAASREAEAPATVFEPTVAPSAPAALKPLSRPAPRPAPRPASRPASRPSPAPPVEAEGFSVALEPKWLRLSFVYATFAYRLTLSNRAPHGLCDIAVSADLISSHSALPLSEQLAPGPAKLAPKHAVPSLAQGETLVLEGEVQCPLAEIVPLHAGAALMFAPLARFRVATKREDGGWSDETVVFSLGQPSQRGTERMQPFRLDLGPQSFHSVEQRPIDTGRWLALDPVREAV